MLNRILWIGAGLALFGSSLFAGVMYSNIPAGSYGNDSIAYNANAIAEFGNAITLAPGTDNLLASVTIVVSDWASASDPSIAAWETANPTLWNAEGYYVPLTVNLYDAGSGNLPGAQIASETVTQFVPWGNGATYGVDTALTFNFSSLDLTLPDSLIATLAFNTSSYTASPGPYDSLNVAVDGVVSTGSNTDPGTAYVNAPASWYSAGTGCTGGYLCQDTGYGEYQMEMEIDSVPEPGTFALLGGALMILGFARRKTILG